jgi:glyoxylase-like metal-dependent hydrolase (beta-lactamase superfamily II)
LFALDAKKIVFGAAESAANWQTGNTDRALAPSILEGYDYVAARQTGGSWHKAENLCSAIASTAILGSTDGNLNVVEPEYIKSFWEPRFPGQLPSQLVAPEVLKGDTFSLEGEELKVVELGHTDTSHTTALYVPSIGLVVSGDGVYNNTHLYLAECDEEAINGWLRALDKIESLHPKTVVAGHGVLDPDSSPRHIEATRGYLHDFLASRKNTSTAMELYQTMLSLHPNRVNPGSLWAAAKASKPS